MGIKIAAAVATVSALLSLTARSDELSYSYLDLAYVNTDVDNFDEEVDGFALRGSMEATENVFMYAEFADQSTEIFGEDLELQTMEVGAGYAWPIADTTDLYGRLGYSKIEAEYLGASADDDGFALGVGLRGRISQSLELQGSVNYADYSDSGDDTSLGAGALWYFTNQFVAGVEADVGDDATTYGVGVRWLWGN